MKGKTKTQKGITLVALIITIVVLLILAVVAITGIKNDGLIGKTDNAAARWNESVKKEQGILDDYLEVLDVGTDIIALKNRALGKDLAELDFQENGMEEIYSSGMDNDIKIYVKYNNNYYSLSATYDEENDVFPIKNVELIYVPQGREGTTVLYDSNGNGIPEEWIIFTDSNGKLEIISKNTLYGEDNNGLLLGGDTEEEAIASYNNAKTLINDYCKSIVKATDNSGVRSVGASEENDEQYIQLLDMNLKNGDYDSDEDIIKLIHLNIADTGKAYWLSSRCIENTGTKSDISLLSMSEGGVGSRTKIMIIINVGKKLVFSKSLGVRPVIINPQLKSAEEWGAEIEEL